MRLTAIFFDLDDTLWDFTDSAATSLEKVFMKYLEGYGVDKRVWLEEYKVANAALWASYQKGSHTSAEVKELRFARSFAGVGVHLSDQAVSEVGTYYLSEIVRNTRLYPGVRDVLRELSSRYRLGIISNGLAVSQSRLDEHGIGEYFRHVVTAADAGAPKPSSAIFAYALNAAGLEAIEAAYVGDDYHSDVIGAKRAGMVAIWYNPAGRQVTGELSPDYVVGDFSELAKLLARKPEQGE